MSDRRRLVASTAAIGLAVMLILLLDGMFAGIKAQTRLYTDNAGADLFVLQRGLREFHDGGVIPMRVVDEIRATPGVDWAEPVRGSHVMLELHGTKAAPYLVGTRPGAPGGAWQISEGRNVRADDEIVIDSVLAERHGLKLGDRLQVMGRPFRVVGTSAEASAFMASYAFVTHAATDELFDARGTTSYVLVGTDHPSAVQARLAAAGLHVLTPEKIAANSEDLASGILSGPLRLMVIVAFSVGTLVIALTAYTAIVERRREYGIVKALGARTGRLVRLALTQTVVLAALGLIGGAVLFFGGRAVIEVAKPQFEVLLTSGVIARTAAATLLMALLAAIIPARGLARLDPASAYRGS